MADDTDVRQPHGVSNAAPVRTEAKTAIVVLSDGSFFYGGACGAEGEAAGELCCSTVMGGYQEVLSDPTYAGQIVAFTYPHIGCVGANAEDMESAAVQARGCILAEPVTAPSSFRAETGFREWLRAGNCVAITGVDTRAIMRRLREAGPLRAVIASAADGVFDIAALQQKAAAPAAPTEARPAGGTTAATPWTQGPWVLGQGLRTMVPAADAPHVVVVDYGAKRSLLQQFAGAGARVTLVPPDADLESVQALAPDGLFLSNGPGNPADAPAALPLIAGWLQTGAPLLAIGLGMQLLALALGAKTFRMRQGRYGVNHPVRCAEDGQVEAVSMNHDYAVDRETLPAGVRETHTSLFDGTVAGLALRDRPVSGVQFHPETPPWQQDCHPLLRQFVASLKKGA